MSVHGLSTYVTYGHVYGQSKGFTRYMLGETNTRYRDKSSKYSAVPL